MFEFIGTIFGLIGIFFGFIFGFVLDVTWLMIYYGYLTMCEILTLLTNILLIVINKLLITIGTVLTSLLNFILLLLLCIVIILFISCIVICAVTAFNNKPEKDSFDSYLKTFIKSMQEKHSNDTKNEVEKLKNISFWQKLMKWLFGMASSVQTTVLLNMLDYKIYDIGIGYLAIVKVKGEDNKKNEPMPFLGVMGTWFSPIDYSEFVHRK